MLSYRAGVVVDVAATQAARASVRMLPTQLWTGALFAGLVFVFTVMCVASGIAVIVRALVPTLIGCPTLKSADETTAMLVTFVCAPVTFVCTGHEAPVPPVIDSTTW